MAIRNIVKEGDPILNKKCHKVEKFDEKLSILIDDMAETLALSGGVGLAAPQVGILRRVVVIDVGQGIIELVNPVITESSGMQEALEGCLSCPNQWGITRRPKNVTVKAQNRSGEEFTISGEDLLAQAFCHELDHLDGILFKEKVLRMLTPEEVADL